MTDQTADERTVSRQAYLTDLTDEQRGLVAPLLPAAKPGGRPRGVDLREVLNSILYVNRSGCQWERLPHDLLPKSTVFQRLSEKKELVFRVPRSRLGATVLLSERRHGHAKP